MHFAKIDIDGSEKDLAIKILRPDIQKIFNQELDALNFLAYLVENIFIKTKRIEVGRSYFTFKTNY